MSSTTSQFDLRRLLLEHARKMLVSQGYNSLSMRKIATQAGYSATTIYLHFKNKDDLLHALIEEGFSKLNEQFSKEIESHSNPLKKIEKLCRSFIDFGLHQPEYYEIMFLMHPEDMKRYPPEKYRKARRTILMLKDVLDEAKASGIMKTDRTDLEAFAIWSSVHGAIAVIHAGRLDVRIDQDEFLKTVLQGIMKRFN